MRLASTEERRIHEVLCVLDYAQGTAFLCNETGGDDGQEGEEEDEGVRAVDER